MSYNDPQFKPGEPFNLETMRRVAELAQRVEHVSGSGNVEVGAGGVRVLDAQPLQRFIRIIAQSPGVGTGVPPTYYYSWEPVRLVGSFSGATYVLDDPPWELDDQAVDVGSYMLLPAIEVNQNTDVAMNTVVRAWLGDDGQSMMFDRAPVGIDVETVDGTPSVTSVTRLEFDEDDGFRVTDLLGGVVRIDIAPASTTDKGVVTAGSQTFGGDKTFQDDVAVDSTLSVDGLATLSGGADVRDIIEIGPLSAPSDVYGTITESTTFLGSSPGPSSDHGITLRGTHPSEGAKANVALSAPTGTAGHIWFETSDGGPNITGVTINVGGIDLYSEGANTPVYRHEGVAGATGTDSVGSVFSGGICTTVGGGSPTPADGSITNAKLADMTTRTIKARKTGSTGPPEDCTLSEVLDFVTSAAQGDILYRDGSAWARLAAGTNLQLLRTAGSGANPAWAFPDARSMLAVTARAFRNAGSGTMTINNATWTVVTMPSESYDTNAIHDTSSNTSRLTVPSGMDGLWFLWLEINPEYVTLGSYDSEVGIKINGGTLTRFVASSGVTSTLVYVQTATAGQYFEPELRQDSGGNYSFPAGGGYLSLSAFYLGAV